MLTARPRRITVQPAVQAAQPVQPVVPLVRRGTVDFEVEHPSFLFTTAYGIGDALSIEAFWPLSLRESLRTIFYACHAAKEVHALFASLPYLSRARHVLLPSGNTTYIDRTGAVRSIPLPEGIHDWNVFAIYGAHPAFQGSTFAVTPSAIPLPAALDGPYVAVVPASSFGRWEGRNFSADDWQTLSRFLDRRNLKGAVLFRNHIRVPDDPRLVNLSGTLDMLASCEVVKRAQGYVGIDSCLACLAAKVFPPQRIAVKATVGAGARRWARLYFAPHYRYDFLCDPLQEPTWD